MVNTGPARGPCGGLPPTSPLDDSWSRSVLLGGTHTGASGEALGFLEDLWEELHVAVIFLFVEG